jgi:chromosome partitioning protein
MHVIAFSNQKGGCGKTTSAINVSASLAHLGKKTLLIDLDPQAHATFGVGVRSETLEHSMHNVLTEQAGKRKNFIEKIILPIDDNFDLAPSHILLSTIEQEFTNKDESVSRLHEVLSSLSFPYDFVIIDCPPSLGFLTFNALRASQTVIVPIELGSFSLMGVSKLLSMIELIRVKLRHTPKVFALPTLVDMRTRFARHMIEQIRDSFADHVLNSSIRQTIVVKESQAKGVPLLKQDPKSKGALDYLILAQEIINKTLHGDSAFLLEDKDKIAIPEDRLKDFILKNESAKEVHLVGDFNQWSVSSQSLLWQKEEGLWQKRLFLDPGRYRYKFVVDGQWLPDPSNQHTEPNPYGGMDSVIEIE